MKYNLKNRQIPIFEQEVVRSYVKSGTGGSADYLTIAESTEDILLAIKFASKNNINYIILGEGSSSLISDFGYSGLMIINRSSNILYLENSQVLVDSGISLDLLATKLANKNLSGLEPIIKKNGSLASCLVKFENNDNDLLLQYTRALNVIAPQPNIPNQIINHSKKWLIDSSGESKIEKLINQEKPMPIILNVRLQLSQARNDTILFKLKQFSNQNNLKSFKGNYLKNVFSLKNVIADTDIKKQIIETEIFKIKTKYCRLMGEDYNNIAISKTTSSQAVKDYIDRLKTIFYQRQGINLSENIVYIGNWREGLIETETSFK